MKLTDVLYLDDGKDPYGPADEGNADYITRILLEHIHSTFKAWAVGKSDPAFYVYGDGFPHNHSSLEAVGLTGGDLRKAVHRFAERVSEGAVARYGENSDHELTLYLEISIAENQSEGLHILISEQPTGDAENDKWLYRWTFDQLPLWYEFRKKGKRK